MWRVCFQLNLISILTCSLLHIVGKSIVSITRLLKAGRIGIYSDSKLQLRHFDIAVSSFYERR